MMEILSSVSSKGQITIPVEIRRMLQVKPRDKVAFRVENGQVQIARSRASLDAVYASIPGLDRPLPDQDMIRIAAEEHAHEAAQEGP